MLNTYGEGALRSSDARRNTKGKQTRARGSGFDWTRRTDRTRRAQKLGSEFGVGRQSRALAALALVGQLLQPLREAAVDRLFPCAQINQ